MTPGKTRKGQAGATVKMTGVKGAAKKTGTKASAKKGRKKGAAKKGAASGKKDAKGSRLEEKLTLKKNSSWEGMSAARRKSVFAMADEYRKFLDAAKTEREAVVILETEAKKNGFVPIDKALKAPKSRRGKTGARVYFINRGKNIALAIMGKRPVEEGINIVASHVDSPRLDLKQNPLYEDGETKLALLKTHYYGGIKKYQWVNIPLAIHGRVITASGSEVDIVIGEDPADPVFTITDLLPHLYRKKQARRHLDEGIKGEELNVLVGSTPLEDKGARKKVKLQVLDHLNRRYGMVEEDFVSAELEVVPALPSRDVGFDRAMVAGYGQDDRICAYSSARAAWDVKTPERTALVLLFDKEEIGSDGTTGVKSRFLENVIGQLLELRDPEYRDSKLRGAMQGSKAISADVNAAVNPMFKDVHEMQNAAKAGMGLVLTKFTGSGGKYMANDASAEFVGEVRRLFNKHKVAWQSAELGKVDEGGGGTVAKFLAQHNMDVIDAGPAIISMHSPFELASKADLYSAYEGYLAFLK